MTKMLFVDFMFVSDADNSAMDGAMIQVLSVESCRAGGCSPGEKAGTERKKARKSCVKLVDCKIQ